ncbi:hypothetical protein M3Y97_01100500 [Aphelenchoides bicaudatus]|nr:hypothetical protein M3Y97_01100500 [Aphelenchoides bicaudatus]
MKFHYIAVCLIVFAVLPLQTEAKNYKGSCVNKFIKYFSEFFTSDQISSYAVAAMEQIIVKANSSKIVSAVIDKAWNSLSSEQYSQGSSLLISGASKFGSFQAINDTIQRCIDGAAPVLLKLYPEVTKLIEQQSATKAKMGAGFKYADGKFQLPLCTELVQKCKDKLTDSQWSKGSSMLKSYIKFATLGFTV